MPTELTIIAVTALLAGLLLVGVMLAGRRSSPARDAGSVRAVVADTRRLERAEGELPGTDATMRVVWWLTTTIVLLGVGISGSFAAEQAPIFLLGGAAVLAVVAFHEIRSAGHGRVWRLAELMAAVALIGGLLAMTGYAASPFSILFALVAVAAALGHGPRAGLVAAGLATVAFAAVLAVDPVFRSYGPDDLLQIGIRLGAIWLLAFISVVYADHQRRVIQRAIDLSRTDPLTGLFNRSQLFVILEQEVSRTRRSDRGFCLLMIDVDGLKAINDGGGHLRGDQVLGALGSVIAGSIRAVDSAYRYGGDEFVVLLPETDIVGAFVVAEKIRAGAEDLELALGTASPASVSIGLVSHPEDGLSAEELMAAADRAMYQAKALGKNQISGNPRPRPGLLARRSTLDVPATPAPTPSREPAPAPADPAPAPASAPVPTTILVGPAVPAAEPPAEDVPQPTSPVAEPAAAPSRPEGASVPGDVVGPADDRAIALPLGPAETTREAPAPGPAAATVGATASPSETHDESEPDPADVRRHFAAASRSFDPDDQVRRAMDAFFSPSLPPPASDVERKSPEH